MANVSKHWRTQFIAVWSANERVRFIPVHDATPIFKSVTTAGIRYKVFVIWWTSPPLPPSTPGDL
ncbi:hypothetical protein J6590_055617 [Homalodisca vitripennis]|nr:hypothetical protein J6590_055617 [Homalodisca vitripennis]